MVGVRCWIVAGIFLSGGSAFDRAFAGSDVAAFDYLAWLLCGISDCHSRPAAVVYGKHVDGDSASVAAEKDERWTASAEALGDRADRQHCGNFFICAGGGSNSDVRAGGPRGYDHDCDVAHRSAVWHRLSAGGVCGMAHCLDGVALAGSGRIANLDHYYCDVPGGIGRFEPYRGGIDDDLLFSRIGIGFGDILFCYVSGANAAREYSRWSLGGGRVGTRAGDRRQGP